MTTSQVTRRNLVLLVFSTLSALISFDAQGVDFYVSPTGDDKADGLNAAQMAGMDGPFRTFARAQQAIRALKQNGRFTEPVTVHVQSGLYELAEPLKFDARDSGTRDKPIVWQGSLMSSTTLSGGKSVACKQADAGRILCPADDIKTRPGKPVSPERLDAIFPDFRVFIKDLKLQIARWPNAGWAHIKQGITRDTVYSAMEDLPDLQSNIGNTQVHIFSGVGWYDEFNDVLSIDKQLNSVVLRTKTKYPFVSGRQFVIQNHPNLLDNPGEWFYDSIQKEIAVIPPAGADGNVITITSVPNLLSINGASYIKFKGLELKYSNDAAVYVNKSHNLEFDSLVVNYVATKAMDIYESDNIQIRNSQIHDTGGGGVYVAGGELTSLKSSLNLIENNHFYNISDDILTSHPAILVSGVGATIRHNLVEQSSNLGIMIYGNNHLIEKNELHHLCLGCADCGGIYASSNWASRGNLIKYNYIHDIIGYGLDHVNSQLTEAVYTSPREGRGIYIDNGASGFEINGNILVNPGEIGIHINGGRDNKIQGNYISSGDSAIWIANREKYMEWDILLSRLAESPYKSKVWTKAYPDLAKPMHKYDWPENNVVTGNVMVKSGGATNSPFLRYDLSDDIKTISKNIVWSNGEPIKVRHELLGKAQTAVMEWGEWILRGLETNSLYADPCIALSGKSLVVCANSPISEINFQPIPKDIGLNSP